MKYAVLLDFGSTYTKVVCVDLEAQRVVLTDKRPSTVGTDARIAMNQCLEAVRNIIGEAALEKALKLSTSSAAGGLRIAVSSLTQSLSLKAGRNASFGAGGKVVYNCAGKLTEESLAEINDSNAEIILLCGGYEGGNTSLLLYNAEVISKSGLNIPVVYAGNSHIVQDIRRIFLGRGKECFIAANMTPDVGLLNIEPTVDIIRGLFMSRITNMKGIGEIKSILDGPVIPTPAAVLAAGTLLYKGTEAKSGIGPYMMVDIGGATTDVYSFVTSTGYNGAKCIGSPEPEAKRTVEGDLGMRESSICLLKEVGKEEFASLCGITEAETEAAITKRITEKEFVATDFFDKRIDLQIAACAVGISARRHAGFTSREFNGGCNVVQRGKNLTPITKVIGTGGILVNNPFKDAEVILKNVQESKEEILLPEYVDVAIDTDYIMFAAGLLSDEYEDVALEIMKQSVGITEEEF